MKWGFSEIRRWFVLFLRFVRGPVLPNGDKARPELSLVLLFNRQEQGLKDNIEEFNLPYLFHSQWLVKLRWTTGIYIWTSRSINPCKETRWNFFIFWIQAKNEKYGLAREAVVVAEVELWDEKRAESSSFYSKITYHRSAYSRGAACLAHFNKEDSIHLTHIHWNQKRVVKSPFG